MCLTLRRYVPTEEQIRAYRQLHNGSILSPRRMVGIALRETIDRNAAIDKLNDAVIYSIRRCFCEMIRKTACELFLESLRSAAGEHVSEAATAGFPCSSKMLTKHLYSALDRYGGTLPYESDPTTEWLRELFFPNDTAATEQLAKSIVTELNAKLSLGAKLLFPDGSGKEMMTWVENDLLLINLAK